MMQFMSWESAREANNWSGQNVVRLSNAEYDWLWKGAAMELGLAKWGFSLTTHVLLC
jgi:hypothetical protein